MNIARAGRGLPLLLFALSALALAPGCNDTQAKTPPPKPPEVLVSHPGREEITDFEDFTGRTEALQTVEVRARVTGYLEQIRFNDGDEVKKGDVLFEIDPRPYQAQYDQAEATLLQAEARQKRTEAAYRRISTAFSRGAASPDERDQAEDNYTEARGAVGTARATRDIAKLNLEWTKVTAPLSGRISRRMVDRGNLVKADDTSLTTIVEQDKLYVYFDVDERTVLEIRRLITSGRFRTRTEAVVPVFIALADETDFKRQGTIDFSESKLDPNTGTLRIRAVIDNPAIRPNVRGLSPGMFVRVRLPIGQPYQALTVAEEALGTDQGRKFVYVVKEVQDTDKLTKKTRLKKVVTTRQVKTGTLKDQQRVVREGLKGDEEIIVKGLQRVRPGVEVVTTMLEPDKVAADAKPTNGESPPLARGDKVAKTANPPGT